MDADRAWSVNGWCSPWSAAERPAGAGGELARGAADLAVRSRRLGRRAWNGISAPWEGGLAHRGTVVFAAAGTFITARADLT